MATEKTADAYLEKHKHWQAALKILRKAVLSFKLDEGIKWQYPVYSLNGKNILGLAAFKSYVGIWFFQGGLLEDNEKKLINAQPGKTKAMLQWRFQDENEVKAELKLIKQYIKESIANAKAGKEIKRAKPSSKKAVVPDELAKQLKASKKLGAAFESLSPYKQKEYCEYISDAKRESTKLNRLDKIKPMILEGKGLNDKYK